MRVGFDARWYNDSGVGTYVAELLKALVPLQSPPRSGHKFFKLIVYEDPRNPVPGLPKNSVTRIAVSAGKYSLGGQMALTRRCTEDRLDVFHSPFYPIPLRAPCPVVVTIHDLIPFLFRKGNPLKRFAVKRGYRLAASHASRIIAVSNHTAQDITKILGTPAHKITVIHNGVSHSAFHATGSSAELHALLQGGIQLPYVVVGSARNYRTKNLPTALRALLRAWKSGPNFQTVVYGPSDGLRAAGGENIYHQLGVIYTGPLRATELARLFRHAHAFMMPSLYEGFGLTMVEAMACGCPVITSNAGSLPEVARQCAQLFEPFDVNGMADAVKKLLSDPAELNAWKQRALMRAADFSWEKTAQETLAGYDQTVNSK